MTAPPFTAAPCAKCPFRKDVPIYLRAGARREIAESLVSGQSFSCHATVTFDEDDDGAFVADQANSSMCAGAAKSLLLDGATTNFMRVMERVGGVDLDRLADRGPEVWPLLQWQRLAEGATGDDPGEDDDEEEDIETCNTVEAGCLAPAGYAGANGGIALGSEAADLRCTVCEEAVCSACADDEGRCGNCHEEAVGW